MGEVVVSIKSPKQKGSALPSVSQQNASLVARQMEIRRLKKLYASHASQTRILRWLKVHSPHRHARRDKLRVAQKTDRS
jgi:hypothetical protein